MSITRVVAIGLFVLAFAGIGLVELLARREGSKVPTLAGVCALITGYRAGRVPVGRIALYGLWWWVGWHFFAR